jgi:serine protease Do
MKQIFTSFLGFIGFMVVSEVSAQEIHSSEVIIRKNGDKVEKMTIEINGDSVIVNGKPYVENENSGNGFRIRKRKMIIGNDESGDLSLERILGDETGRFESSVDSVAFLGVSTETNDQGAEITEITPGSAAEKSGLQLGDVITDVDDFTITDPGSLAEAIQSYKPRSEVKIKIRRNGKNKTVKATLNGKVNMKKNIMVFKDGQGDGNSFRFSLPPMEGWDQMILDGGSKGRIDFGSMPKKQKLGIKTQDTEQEDGVKILEVTPGSPAALAGLMADDKIVEIAGRKIKHTDDVRNQLYELRDSKTFSIKYFRNGQMKDCEVKFPKSLATADF